MVTGCTCLWLTKRALQLAALAGAVLLTAAPCRAAELRLRPQCTVKATVVTLGDVAEILTTSDEQANTLAAVELFPAPVAGRQQYVRLREVQDLLVLRGINLTEHRFSGSNQVAVAVAAAEPVARPEPEPAVSCAAMRRINRRVHDAILQYLKEHVGAAQGWTVDLELSPSQMRSIGDGSGGVKISGGAAPWTGTQRFEVLVETAAPPVSVPVEAQVTVPAAVVVTVHAMGRGAVIRETDVELQRGPSRQTVAGACSTLEDVVGKETTRAIAEGKVIDQESLRAPLLVRRGDVVTVYARGSGIRVRSTARARDDGSLGDLIAVESLQDRSAFFARVNAVQEVEVLASSIAAEERPAGQIPRLTSRQPRK